MKELIAVQRNVEPHWVGNGFPVRTLFSTERLGEYISPFLLLDYAGPAKFSPSDEPRGVGEHPHRGFETVTFVYQGRLEHRDSAGHHGTIGPGDVQWMTAASGVVHEEWHEQQFTRQGGTLEMVQLWVNLPAKDKMSAPRYQEILNQQIPMIPLEGDRGTVRVIAGQFRGTQGPAHTFTPINAWDLQLKAGASTELEFPEGFSTLLLVIKGKTAMNGSEPIRSFELAVFDRQGGSVTIEAQEDSALLVLSGQPINEPVVSYGPFVMNTRDEIRQAIDDYRSGRMGHLAAST